MKTAYVVALSVAVPALLSQLAGRRVSPKDEPHLPSRSRDGGYVGSSACRSCHPSEFSSWQSSYHRSMTRPASDLSWDGKSAPSLPAKLDLDGRETLVEADEDGLIWVQGPDLHAAGAQLSALKLVADDTRSRAAMEQVYHAVDNVRRQLVMVTGSHHYLAFWVEGGKGRELRQLPFVFHLAQAEWAPRDEVFLQPPDAPQHIARWNANCIQCHAVAGRPRQSEGRDEVTGELWVRYDSRVAELGISCEACHGAGKDHVHHYQDPLARHRARNGPSTPLHIVNPQRLPAAAGSAVCGQCHSYFSPLDPDQWWEEGFFSSFSPGDSLDSSRAVLTPREDALTANGIAGPVESMFWDDGTIRVGGREYNGLIASPCFDAGGGPETFSCTSCHSMHESSPDDQLAFDDSDDDRMCTSCHTLVAADLGHSGHQPQSIGSRCVNCHMPKTTYALLKSIRSHRISSPRMLLDEPPSACSLCHVDQSRQWLAEKLTDLWGMTASEAPLSGSLGLSLPSGQDLPHAVERALAGNAAERALLADALASDEVLITAGTSVGLFVLPYLKDDPYAAVRRIAARSLARLKSEPRAPEPGGSFSLSPELAVQLTGRRDDRPITISE